MCGKGGNGFAHYFIFVLVLTYFCDRTSSGCTQLTPCVWMFPDGQGYNLTQLGNSGNLTASDKNHTIYFHPCTNVRLSSNNTSDCWKGNGVSLCVVDHWDNDTFSLGTVEDTRIEAQSDNSKEPVLTIRHENYTTFIELTCCDHCKTHLAVDSIVDKKDYRLLLVSPYACKVQIRTRGLSTGSLLVIYFFVFSGLYFIGGAIALKLLRGATRWELLPNHKFWCDLPSLVRDGIVFTFNCCRADSYERI